MEKERIITIEKERVNNIRERYFSDVKAETNIDNELPEIDVAIVPKDVQFLEHYKATHPHLYRKFQVSKPIDKVSVKINKRGKTSIFEVGGGAQTVKEVRSLKGDAFVDKDIEGVDAKVNVNVKGAKGTTTVNVAGTKSVGTEKIEENKTTAVIVQEGDKDFREDKITALETTAVGIKSGTKSTNVAKVGTSKATTIVD